MTVFHPGVNHNHQPCGRWDQIQKDPNSPGASWLVIAACKLLSPQHLVDAAVLVELGGSDTPLALKHVHWYLTDGKGQDFNEDANIKAMLEQDSDVQKFVRDRIDLLDPGRTRRGRFTDRWKLEQFHYGKEDFRKSFGAIDNLDIEVDFDAGTVHVWFQDRYEWHPVYPGLYSKFADDSPRETNCVHAAMVELKSGWPASVGVSPGPSRTFSAKLIPGGAGAADFWMKGEATVPLNTIGFKM
jgi:hypothetical protein